MHYQQITVPTVIHILYFTPGPVGIFDIINKRGFDRSYFQTFQKSYFLNLALLSVKPRNRQKRKFRRRGVKSNQLTPKKPQSGDGILKRNSWMKKNEKSWP